MPGVNQQRVPKLVGLQQQPDWCHDIYLQEDLQVVYVPVGGSVYGFRVQDGERINNWEDIHKQTITAVVHPPGSNHVITGSHDLTAKVCAVSYMLQLCVPTRCQRFVHKTSMPRCSCT